MLLPGCVSLQCFKMLNAASFMEGVLDPHNVSGCTAPAACAFDFKQEAQTDMKVDVPDVREFKTQHCEFCIGQRSRPAGGRAAQRPPLPALT